MSETGRVCAQEVDEGLFTKGAQVFVLAGGEPQHDLALGDSGTGTPMATDTVSRVYCTIKPLAAVAAARQVDAGALDLDEPLDRRLPGVASVADGTVTLRHLLSHTAGLHRPMALELELVAPDKRAAHIDRAPRPTGWQVGRQAAYSEHAAWLLLGRILEDVTGEPVDVHLRTALIEPLGLTDTWVGMSDDDYDALLPRLGLSYDMRTLTPFPLLLERGRRMCTEVNPAHGGYTTARDLARFYAALLDQLAGAEHPALPRAATLREFTSPARPHVYDEVLGRECGYGLGFMTGLAEHAFGRWCSAASFGHSGNVGSSFAFADPERDLAVGVVFNGVVDAESAFLRRPALVRAVYTDLDAAESPEEPEAPAEAEPPRRRFRLRR